MTPGKLFAILLIFLGASGAWAILAGSVYTRTDSATSSLRSEVEGLWGTPHNQRAPQVTAKAIKEKTRRGRKAKEEEEVKPAEGKPPASVLSSDIRVDLRQQFRRKGLIWYRTYDVEFDADYRVGHNFPKKAEVSVRFNFPSQTGVYDDFELTVGDRKIENISGYEEGVLATVEAEPDSEVPVKIRYKSRGLDEWRYSFGEGIASVKDFKLTATTDFDRYNFPENSISPNTKEEEGGRKLVWDFESTILGQGIAVEMPDVLNPGPFAARVSAFAPVGLLFFCAVLVIVGMMWNRNLHPMHFFFLAAAFFAFHLLLSYTADHIDVHLAFLISAITSVLLVVSYLLRAAGGRFTFLVAAPSQLLFLVLFSYSFFFRGYTGLTITIGSIITLAILMHVTAKVDWNDKLGPAGPIRSNGIGNRE